jgi:hypothetical protein
MKQGVAAALARLLDPALCWAVVYDTDRWHPHQPPAGSEWDYEPFVTEQLAREALAHPQPDMSDLELWEKRDDGWHPSGEPSGG